MAAGWAGAAFALTTAGTGAATSTPFLVEALRAVAAAPAVAMNAFLVKLVITFETAVLAGAAVSIIFSSSVPASLPALAWARAAPSAFERSTLAI